MSDRHVFGELVLVPSRRALHRSGGEIALIPRTLDLLLLIRRRDRRSTGGRSSTRCGATWSSQKGPWARRCGPCAGPWEGLMFASGAALGL